ncbi:MAG TPA: hypothetical protein VKB46_12865 [Pyrinomonadaceae bacterium]|nr:hypothetical protein [Pyrinomonadaceae bacterium]
MMRPRATRIVALVLAVIAGAVFGLGYDFVIDHNIRKNPEINALDVF